MKTLGGGDRSAGCNILSRGVHDGDGLWPHTRPLRFFLISLRLKAGSTLFKKIQKYWATPENLPNQFIFVLKVDQHNFNRITKLQIFDKVQD
jgi:hypothetical protein